MASGNNSVLDTDLFKKRAPEKFILLKLDNPNDKSKQTPAEIARELAAFLGGARASLDIAVYDSQCGLKLLPAAAYETIRPVLSVMSENTPSSLW